MLTGISYWSLPGGLANTCPVNEALHLTKAAAFDALELAIAQRGVVHTGLTERQCAAIRKTIDASGVRVESLASGMSWGHSPTDPRASVRKRAVELHRRALERAAWLGCSALLLVPGAISIPWNPSFGPVGYKDAVRWAAQAIGQLSRTAERLKVDLCVENVWNGMFYSPLEFRDFLDSFGSPRVHAYFDVGNVLGYHQDPPDWIGILGPRIARVHVKDFKRATGNLSGFCDLGDGDVPWNATLEALRRIRYRGTLIAEMMPPAEGLLERTSRFLARLLSRDERRTGGKPPRANA